MMEYINEYIGQLYLVEELEHLEEADLKKIVQRITPKEKLNDISKKFKRLQPKRPEEILNSIKKLNIPKVEPDKIDRYFSKKSDYKKLNKKAETVLKNSFSKASPKMINAAATYITLRSFMKLKKESDNLDKRFKENLKKFVYDVEDQEEKNKNKIMPSGSKLDFAIGFSIIWSIIVILSFWIYGVIKIISIAEPVLFYASFVGLLMFLGYLMSLNQ